MPPLRVCSQSMVGNLSVEPIKTVHLIGNIPPTRSVNSVDTEFTYVNPFHLKESKGEGANHLRSPPYCVICSSKFGEDWWKLKEEVVNNET